MSGPVALVGSGEYLPVMAGVEAACCAGPTAAVRAAPDRRGPRGRGVAGPVAALGREQAERLGVEQVPVLVRDRADADSPELAALVEGAGLVYLSGGNPPYLARTLRGTRVWAAIVAAWQAGAALAGCSAGAMALTSWVPDLRAAGASPTPGSVPSPTCG